jgi:hypothetical protein
MGNKILSKQEGLHMKDGDKVLFKGEECVVLWGDGREYTVVIEHYGEPVVVALDWLDKPACDCAECSGIPF